MKNLRVLPVSIRLVGHEPRSHLEKHGLEPTTVPNTLCSYTPGRKWTQVPLKRGIILKGNESSSNHQLRGHVFVWGSNRVPLSNGISIPFIFRDPFQIQTTGPQTNNHPRPSKWLITMVIISPLRLWGCGTSSKWSIYMAYKWGAHRITISWYYFYLSYKPLHYLSTWVDRSK